MFYRHFPASIIIMKPHEIPVLSNKILKTLLFLYLYTHLMKEQRSDSA